GPGLHGGEACVAGGGDARRADDGSEGDDEGDGGAAGRAHLLGSPSSAARPLLTVACSASRVRRRLSMPLRSASASVAAWLTLAEAGAVEAGDDDDEELLPQAAVATATRSTAAIGRMRDLMLGMVPLAAP